MTNRRWLVTTLIALALPTGASAQVGEPRPERRTAPTAEQRAEMRDRIETRFLDMAAERLELDASQRTRLGGVLEQNSENRREIAEEGLRLRREAAELLRTDSPDGAAAERILGQLTRLRERELDLWRAEQQALAGVLSPVQRLELMAMRARLNERVRDVRDERAPRGPRGPRGERQEGAVRAPRAPAAQGGSAPVE